MNLDFLDLKLDGDRGYYIFGVGSSLTGMEILFSNFFQFL